MSQGRETLRPKFSFLTIYDFMLDYIFTGKPKCYPTIAIKQILSHKL